MTKTPLTVTRRRAAARRTAAPEDGRPASVIAAIAEARSHGDLSENAEYDAAKERQSFIEGRIAEVEAQARQRAGDRSRSCSMPTAAACSAPRSTCEEQASGDKVTYQIVGDDEADIKHGKISISSPIARALIGKYAGDVVEVQTPGGVREYEIIDVRYE